MFPFLLDPLRWGRAWRDSLAHCAHVRQCVCAGASPAPWRGGDGGRVSVHKISEGIRPANAHEWTHHELAAASIRHRNRAILPQHTYKLLFQPHHLHESSDMYVDMCVCISPSLSFPFLLVLARFPPSRAQALNLLVIS